VTREGEIAVATYTRHQTEALQRFLVAKLHVALGEGVEVVFVADDEAVSRHGEEGFGVEAVQQP
jgi:hypothetical protein